MYVLSTGNVQFDMQQEITMKPHPSPSAHSFPTSRQRPSSFDAYDLPFALSLSLLNHSLSPQDGNDSDVTIPTVFLFRAEGLRVINVRCLFSKKLLRQPQEQALIRSLPGDPPFYLAGDCFAGPAAD